MALLERDHALRDLENMLAHARAGQGMSALIAGEAGIGKTTLIEQFTATHRQAIRVLWVACDALFTPRPLGPVHDLALQIQGDLPRLVSGDVNRTILFSTILGELQQQPSIVVFEDVHWADEATLDLLKFLGRRIQRTSALLVLSYRDDELGVRHPLRFVIGDLATSSATHRIILTPLSPRSILQLIGDRPIDPITLHQRTGGNPFFVTEVLATPHTDIPPSVRDSILGRAARLSASGRAVLEAAAVIGMRIEPAILIEIVRAESEAIGACIELGLLVSQHDWLAFRHELARQTILESLLPQRKLMLHQLVLEALRSSPGTRANTARLAEHAEAAGHAEAVLEYATIGARQAAAVSAHREAAAQYARALRFAGALPPEQHALLLENYAWECNIIEQRPEGIVARRRALEFWRAIGNPLKQAENLYLLSPMYFVLGDTTQAEVASQTAIELLSTLPPGRERAHAYRIQAALRMFNRDVEEAIVWGERAVVLAEQYDDPEALSAAYNAIGSAQIFLDYTAGRASLERSLAIAQANGLESSVANAYTNLGSASGEVYQFLDADRDLTKGIAFCIEHDQDNARLYMQAWQALTRLYLGRWNEASEAAAIVLRHPGASAISKIMALTALGLLRARRGDPGAAEALDEALELAERASHLQRLGPVRIARAEAAWLEGNRVRASAEAAAVYDLAIAKHHAWFAGGLGIWLWRTTETTQFPDWMARPFALQIAGEWRLAAQEWERLGCPYEQALALIDGDGAGMLAASDILARLGARPALEEARQRISAITTRRLDKERYAGLTRREYDVAILIAQGKSNREIAQALTVGVKTVETYVTRMLSKLDFTSRVQIATWAVGKGLTQTPSSEP